MGSRGAGGLGSSDFSYLGNKGGHLAPTDKGIGRVPACSLDGHRAGARSASRRAAVATAVRHGTEPAAARPARASGPGDIPRLWAAGCERSARRRWAAAGVPGASPELCLTAELRSGTGRVHAGPGLSRQRRTIRWPRGTRRRPIDRLRTNRLGWRPCHRPRRGCNLRRLCGKSRLCPSSSPARLSLGSGISRFKSATSCRWSSR